ncbi:glycosyltransferase family 2 protein [Aerococcaceae bacterium NML180378]|nr:glycosyltransferase family 2 protein [Aerococcaceae bacterium NML180378]
MPSYIEHLVSIVTPVYQAERFIAETIRSVQQQTYTNWELILVNDCTPDQSAAVIEPFLVDERIRLLHLETNSGAAVARNTGLAVAKGRYIAFIDSDDCWAPEKLATQLAFMQQQQVSFTYTNFAIVAEDGQMLKERVNLPSKLDYHGLLKNTAIACSTVMIDRKQVGNFVMPLVRKGQDTATWLKLMREQQLTAYLVDEVLNHYRQVQGSISSNKIGALKRTWHTYRHLERLPLHKCMYYFTHYVVQAILRRK